MPIINYNKRHQSYPIKYNSTADAEILYQTVANADGSLDYHQYSDTLFSLHFLNGYNYNNINDVTKNNGYYQFNNNGIVLSNLYNQQITNNFTVLLTIYPLNLTKQQVLFSNSQDNFQVILNPICYNNCIVFKFGDNIHYQQNILKLNKWNNIIYRCDGNNIQSFINHWIKKQPIEKSSLNISELSIGLKYRTEYNSKFFYGYIKEFNLYSVYKNNNFVNRY